MATSKAKSAKKSAAKKTVNKSEKAKSTASKAKAAVKTTSVKATKKPKVVAKEVVKEPVAEKTKVMSEKAHPVKEFFARKGDPNENILTIFKDTKIIGALIGEIVGTGLVTAVALTLGFYNPLYLIVAYITIIAAVHALSGAHLNPLITAGMMATRRVSAIRGVLYFIAQILGAWCGYMIVNGFYNAGIASGNIAAESTALPVLAAADSVTATTEGFSFFWPITMIEFVGAIIIAFCYARATNYRRGVFTFAAIVAGGIFLAMLYAVVICNTFLGISDNVFVMNPAAGLMYGMLPASAEGFDALMGAMMPMVVTYVIFPILGGIIGFYLSDISAKLRGEKLVA